MAKTTNQQPPIYLAEPDDPVVAVLEVIDNHLGTDAPLSTRVNQCLASLALGIASLTVGLDPRDRAEALTEFYKAINFAEEQIRQMVEADGEETWPKSMN